SFHVADFDGDGVDDVEALTPNGYVDTYFGCAEGSTTCTPGLSSKFELDTFPSGDRDDGKFAILTGTGDGSYPAPQATFAIGTLSTEIELVVDIFDGFFGSGWDLRINQQNGDYCFKLFADKNSDGTGTTQIIPGGGISASKLRANEWSTIYRGANSADAK